VALLPEIFRDCKGNAVRVQEILHARYDITVAYSTLTRLIREATELRAPKKRSGTYPLGPGEEMQHDTSPHRVVLGAKAVRAECASLVLAYSRMLFIQYYPCFTRFEAKAFLSEALRFFDGACPRCVIDNTSVVLAGGSGANAVIAPQMEAFGALFGVEFFAHAIGHSDRKGRIERPFSYVENNFLAGRHFSHWADLNAQARAWCEEVANAKPKRVLGMSPQAAYVLEKPYLLSLPPYLPPVTEIHHRVVDSYGFVHLETNRYSVPERLVGKKVAVHKRPEQVLIYLGQTQVAAHPRLIGQRQAEHRIEGHHTRAPPCLGSVAPGAGPHGTRSPARCLCGSAEDPRPRPRSGQAAPVARAQAHLSRRALPPGGGSSAGLRAVRSEPPGASDPRAGRR